MKTDFRTYAFEDLGLDDLYAVMRLRSEVFVVEQDCVYLDLDGRDLEALHLLGKRDGRLISYTRIFGPNENEGACRFGRVVVDPALRGQGLGKELLEATLRVIEGRYPGISVHISAQAHLLDYYRAFGFAASGDPYLEDGIPHIEMNRQPDTRV